MGAAVPRYPKSDRVPQLFAVRIGIAATSSDFDRFAALAAMIPVAADFTCSLI
jgi:hypothetical protein